jgi:hypothetical protein
VAETTPRVRVDIATTAARRSDVRTAIESSRMCGYVGGTVTRRPAPGKVLVQISASLAESSAQPSGKRHLAKAKQTWNETATRGEHECVLPPKTSSARQQIPHAGVPARALEH